jgi:hypothetical protein
VREENLRQTRIGTVNFPSEMVGFWTGRGVGKETNKSAKQQGQGLVILRVRSFIKASATVSKVQTTECGEIRRNHHEAVRPVRQGNEYNNKSTLPFCVHPEDDDWGL